MRCGVVTEEWVREIQERQEVVRNLAREWDGIFVPSNRIG